MTCASLVESDIFSPRVVTYLQYKSAGCIVLVFFIRHYALYLVRRTSEMPSSALAADIATKRWCIGIEPLLVGDRFVGISTRAIAPLRRA